MGGGLLFDFGLGDRAGGGLLWPAAGGSLAERPRGVHMNFVLNPHIGSYEGSYEPWFQVLMNLCHVREGTQNRIFEGSYEPFAARIYEPLPGFI